ncbi:MAG: hypothetical protein HZC51_12415 [Nitrospirae bacterium]|nr:hypothetical protein [Nitrospirota bacterium]
MPIDENGFLGKEAELSAGKIYEKHKDYFDFCYDVNQFAQKEKYKFEPSDNDGQKLVAILLFTRILNSTQAGVFLINRGFCIEGAAMVRIVFELLIYLKNCCTDKRFHIQYAQQDILKRRKRLNTVVNNYPDDSDFEKIKEYVNSGGLDELNREIKRENIKELPTKFDLAKKVGMKHDYDTVYRLNSDAIHPSIKSLEKYVLGEYGELKTIDSGPNDNDAEIHLCTFADYLLIAVHDVSILFYNDIDPSFETFRDRLNQLLDKYSETWKPSTP